ncbi:Scavenger mrna decapping enzyme [Mycena venus]|uniref:Scavenger mrna decapping enzyme n=1 Tax=Mycena venus TaxID=2733690 RepID=A0A8H7D252_9AGAR|nr:Scavenger mrna decapping enzyme [Mycena venus]
MELDANEGTAFESRLHGFVFERILLEGKDLASHLWYILGSFPASYLAHSTQQLAGDIFPAIIRIEKTAVPLDVSQHIFPDNNLGGFLSKVKRMESTDIYTWLAGWISANSVEKQPQGDVKVNIICPATTYSKQSSILVRETPDIYRRIVEPYISEFPPERTRWQDFHHVALVTEILEGRKEQSKILFSSSSFLILPDMKWDLHTIGSLYLVAIVRDEKLRSLRDLRIGHIELLKSIRREASGISQEKWGIPPGGLRMYIHYQPSYYHFHVHIVNANYEAGMGMSVGQAHLLEDVIALLELDEKTPDIPGIFERMTLTYGLGEQHGLYTAMKAVQEEI